MNESGRKGEAAAEAYLILKGYEIIEKNFSCRFGEIDLIAAKGRYLVFCEVKTRSDGAIVGAVESVGPQKIARIIRAASYYLSSGKHSQLQPRFDVIAVRKRGPFYFVSEHIEDAFS